MMAATQHTGPGDRRERRTPHQTEVYERLLRRSAYGRDWVAEASVGSHGALWHLIRKGWVEVRQVDGPRGGARYYYRPIPVPLAEVGWHAREFPGYAYRDFWCDCGCGTRLNLTHGLQRIVCGGSVRYAVNADHAAKVDALFDRPMLEAVARLDGEVEP